MRIIIVDDDKGRAEGLRSYLIDKQGLTLDQVHCAECVTDAKVLLKASYFDVLILDVVLPLRVGDKAQYENGISLLRRVCRPKSSLKKPEIIIGITSHIDEIQSYSKRFAEHLRLVIEAPANSDQWKPRILEALNYTVDSRINRAVSNKKITALTIHGIRTFGTWQNRLARMGESYSDAILFNTYKYGYISLLAFYIPFFFRRYEVERLKKSIKYICSENPDREVIIFAHSFGTYLVANAIKELLVDGQKIPLRSIVLCGSVLSSKFDWTFLADHRDIRIINDCGSNDYVLWMSEAFVPSSGMAGKLGFYGLNNDRFINRFFSGRHNLYFSDEFMKKHWLPLFDVSARVYAVDNRVESNFLLEGVEQIVSILGSIKGIALFAGLCWLIYLSIKLYLGQA